MALDYDGVDDLVDHGDITSINGTAVLSGAIWVYLTVSELGAGVFDKSTSSTVFALLQDAATADKILFRTHATNTDGGRSTNSFSYNAWQHWAFIYDGGGAANADRLKLWLNGVQETVIFTGTVPATLASVAVPVRTGLSSATGTYTDGNIGLVKLWLAALSAAEIAQEMNSYRPVRTANLILWSPYDDGTKAVDYSGSGNHGTVTGALKADGPYVGGGFPVGRSY